MDIAFIAPYENIRTKAQSIIETNNYPAKTYVGDLQSGVEAARQAIDEGAKIVISRGGTARLIRESLGIEVIEVGGSIYRVLAYIHENTTLDTKIAIVGFRQFISLVQPVCDILGRTHRTFILSGSQSLDSVTDEVVDWNPDVVIGDAVSVRMAQSRDLHFHLIESSMETLVDAFEQARLVLNNMRRHIDNAEKLSAVLNCTKEGAILINKEGRIEEVNKQGCRLLRDQRQNIIGKTSKELFPTDELEEARANRKRVSNILVHHHNTQLALEHVVIAPEEDWSGSVVLFQKVEQIEEAGNAIRKKLLDKGFYAKYTFGDILHQSTVMQNLLMVARHYSGMNLNIMIQGETGTGKELFAQSIHNESPLAEGPFVAVNCAALSGTLLESELFGYAPGAFTGALRTGKTGLFELANGGTLFLDEITEMDIFLQAKLLRALQSREIMRIGDNKVVPIDVRVISATNRNPHQSVRDGKLRADLFFRLNVLDLQIPPLRERPGDAQFLFQQFLSSHSEIPVSQIQPPRHFLDALERYSWPGNVRELQNLATKYFALRGMPDYDWLQHLTQEYESALDPVTDQCRPLNEVIAEYVQRTLARENGNIAKTATRLGIDRNTVKRWLAKTCANGESD